MSNNTDCMIDLETLDVLPTATVLTIGAVRFDPFGDELAEPTCQKFYVRVDIDSCDAIGCTVSQSTLDWWAQQSPAAQNEAFGVENRIPIEQAMNELYKFCWGAKRVWSHGAAFDIVILENLFRKVGKAIPWNFWQVRCTRTLFDVGINPKRAEVTAHNALEDAYDQMLGVQRVYRTLRTSTTKDGNYIAPLANER